jgi:hypothetical protein
MPQQANLTTENNFTKGLITEFTGLNFPENAATDTDNCLYSVTGDVSRRLGIDFEENYATDSKNRTGRAVNSFLWKNAGGDGVTQIVVVQVGAILTFYKSSSSTNAAPLSSTLLASEVNLTQYYTGLTPDPAAEECQFASGNGYLFVYHPRCQPFFCSYSADVITSNIIPLKVRDFTGVVEAGGVSVNDRPLSLSNQHLYNLINQGWTQGSPWVAETTGAGVGPLVSPSGLKTFNVAAGITGTNIGDQVTITNQVGYYSPIGTFVPAGTAVMAGVLSSYSGTTMVINVQGDFLAARDGDFSPYRITPYNKGYINTWKAGLSNYPSNADVWWYFKNPTNNFDPVATINQVTLNSGNAPKGHFILDAFDLDRTLKSSIPGLDPVSTSLRPRTGTWFQGRVWYAGVDASFAKSATSDFYTWTENIYFSQVVTGPEQFGACHQLNDPTSETLFDLLPTDGGVITIQDAGAIYKLFPLNNGLLVFASNGIWFITGSQGIGFTANDYTILKVSSVQSISGTSIVDVQGMPYFWNEEGIYTVSQAQSGGLQVESITVSTIQSFYDNIPATSKRFARGVYNPIDYVIQWLYHTDANNDDIVARYEFGGILNYNTVTKAFYPYTLDASMEANPTINGALYLPTSLALDNTSTPAAIKYLASINTGPAFLFTFADEQSTNYLDWSTSTGGIDYESFFVTGYKVYGKGLTRFQVPYVVMYSRDLGDNSYNVQSIWDFAIDPNSGKYSSPQRVNIWKPRFGMHSKRLRIRGMGRALQFKVFSTTGKPFDIMGWAVQETINTSA